MSLDGTGTSSLSRRHVEFEVQEVAALGIGRQGKLILVVLSCTKWVFKSSWHQQLARIVRGEGTGKTIEIWRNK